MSKITFKRSYVTAGIICAVVAVWVISGQIDSAVEEDAAVEDTGSNIMTVRVTPSEARKYTNMIVLRGRTEAFRSVELKTETQGKITELPAEKGERVKAGDAICKLDVADRQAQLDEASALARQRKLEYDAARTLSEKGFRSETNVAAAAAALDAANAQVERMTIELENTIIRAPFDGVVDERPVELGDYLGLGGVCATLLDEDPYLVIGEVAERDVGALSVGAETRIELSDGRQLTGTLRYVSQAASEITRTFRVEIVVPNPNHTLREGLSANVYLPVRSLEAHLVSPSLLVLNTEGQIGVRSVDENSHVQFNPVSIIGEDPDGVWVTGLPEEITLITVGQDFVEDGAPVRVAAGKLQDQG